MRINDSNYRNMVTGLGVQSMDKGTHTIANAYSGSDYYELANMFIQDGVAERIVSSVIQNAFKEEPSITLDEDGEIAQEAYKLGLFDAIQTAGEYTRMFGGALIVTEFENDNDEESLKLEVNVSKPVIGYKVFSAPKVNLNSSVWKGTDVEVFRITRLDGKEIDVHASRCTVIKGKQLPDVLSGQSVNERFFGVSSLKACENSLKNLAGAYGSIVNMIQETGIALFSLENLNMMLSKPDCGLKDLQELMSSIKLSMSSMRAIFSDKNDSMQIMSHSFAGIPEVIQKLINNVSSDSGIPVSILFGQSATGLAQTNDGDLRAFGSLVEQWRQKHLYKPLCKLIEELATRNFKRSDVKDFTWGNVLTMSTKEKLEAMEIQARMLNTYAQMGVISTEEIRNAIFVNGHTFDISLEA